jgi:hypothetical protein
MAHSSLSSPDVAAAAVGLLLLVVEYNLPFTSMHQGSGRSHTPYCLHLMRQQQQQHCEEAMQYPAYSRHGCTRHACRVHMQAISLCGHPMSGLKHNKYLAPHLQLQPAAWPAALVGVVPPCLLPLPWLLLLLHAGSQAPEGTAGCCHTPAGQHSKTVAT